MSFRAPLSVAAMFLAFAALSACGQQRPTLLTVQASASTRAAPDLALVTLGVLARGANAQAAQQAQAERMAAVMAAARAAGAAEADVQTVGYSIEPQYAYPRNAAPRITGYVSRNIVSIRLENLNAVTTLIDATVAEGANELHGIQFTFKDDEASRDAARAQAMQTARRRADAYAEAAGMRVARVDSVTEAGAPVPAYDARYDGYSMRAMNESSAQSVAPSPIAAGELDSYASVIVVFELR